jgi:hypothetical protein
MFVTWWKIAPKNGILVLKSPSFFLPNEGWFMPPDPRPDPDPDRADAPEPAGSGSQPAPGSGGACWSDEEEESSAYIAELMAAVAAGEDLITDDIAGAGFAQGGTADQMCPGPDLATLIHAATTSDKILATVSDDALIGILRGVRRLESLTAWAQLTTLREFAARRADPPPPPAPSPTPASQSPGSPAAGSPAAGSPAAGSEASPAAPAGSAGSAPAGSAPAGSAAGPAGVRRVRMNEFGADEVAADLGMTWQSAASQIAYACTVAERLPRNLAALRAGKIHPVHLQIIADETAYLAEKYLAEADEKLAAAAQGQTFGKLRYLAHRLVLKLDPGSALRRKDAARKDAHVRRFREASGNAGMVARELPPDQVLASWQHIDQRARDLRAAGLPGTLEELRAQAYCDLLQERDSRDFLTDPTDPEAAADPAAAADPPAPQQPGGPGTPPDGPKADTGPEESDGPGEDDDLDASDGPGESDDPGDSDDPDGSDGPGGDAGPGGDGGSGGSGGSGRGPGHGPAGSGGTGTGRSARDSGPSLAAQVTITVPLATLLGRSATPGEAGGFGLLDPDSARDVVAAAARHADTRWCVTALHPDGTAAAHACVPGRHLHPPDPATLKFTAVIRGPCDHGQAQAGYRPGRTLRHLIAARNTTCTAPGCGQPATACDLDHTSPWHHGGPTCPCNLSPLCRHHHRMKQAQGWWLDQLEPGVLRWRTPAGRTYTTNPTAYTI